MATKILQANGEPFTDEDLAEGEEKRRKANHGMWWCDYGLFYGDRNEDAPRILKPLPLIIDERMVSRGVKG